MVIILVRDGRNEHAVAVTDTHDVLVARHAAFVTIWKREPQTSELIQWTRAMHVTLVTAADAGSFTAARRMANGD